MRYCYDYPRPMVTVDILLLRGKPSNPEVLLIRRANPPFAGYWALPGGFVDENEGLETAAQRELEEETGLTGVPLRQLGAFGDPGRDPRGHTITIVYGAVIEPESASAVRAGDDARQASWFPLQALPPLAFDHQHLIKTCLPRLISAN